ncbi:hypothetical protein CPB83DRAFT_383442 [Crepidotus variabilis]|uniref:Uncharacterized protein n=1 Tax=Crepidotus variabilis TaxID=179855 RepID=A0A9P6JPB6_9AGAR|nr:hypothetical protein CPB83DRAFT_383442 [Crepidotus variabilis]
MIIYFASIAISIYSGVDLIKAFQQRYYYNWKGMAAWICLGVAINCLVTLLIAYKLIAIRRSLAKVMNVSVQDRNSKNYLGVISILIESTLPLAISGILLVAFINPSKTIPSAVAQSMFSYL